MDVFEESRLRANIIAWLPIRPSDTVCYIGGEKDVIAEKLREMSERVDCTAGGACIGNYDYIISLGSPMEEIGHFYSCLSEKGILIFGAANAYGLKYLAGAKEIGSGKYFGGVEADASSKAYTKEELSAAAAAAGFAWQQFYYPFPDYHFTMSLFSDSYLPKRGGLIDSIGNFDSERLVLFDEAKAADALLARGKFQEFSNSYLIVAGKGQAEPVKNEYGEEISYVKFSNDRGRAHNIVTYLTRSKDGRQHLLKVPDGIQADRQIEKMRSTCRILKELYAGTRFRINDYIDRENGVEFAFLSGHTMEEELDGLLERGEAAQARHQLLAVLKEIGSCKDMQEFQLTEDFQVVFGNAALPEGLLAAPASDIDMIMPNIFIEEDGSWTVIDYEWSFHFPIPVHFIFYRAIRYYADTTADRRAIGLGELYEAAGITEEEQYLYSRMEESFQNYVLSGHKPMRQKYRESGKPAYHVTSVLHVVDEFERRRALQIYFDMGNGFSEDHTRTYHSKALDGTYCLEIPVGGNVERVRIDPGSQACTVDIRRIAWRRNPQEMTSFISNGHKLSGNLYLFDTDDPNILLTELPDGERTLLVDVRIDSMSLAAAKWIAPKIDVKYRLKKMLGK